MTAVAQKHVGKICDFEVVGQTKPQVVVFGVLESTMVAAAFQ